MKKVLMGIAALIVAAPMVAGAQTQQRPADRPAADRDAAKQADTRPAWKPEGQMVDSSNLIGMRVKDAEGKDLGEIDRLIIAPQDGKITHVVVGMGGLLGVGEKKVVVPWSDVKMSAAKDGRHAVMMDKVKLEAAPRYDRAAVSTDRSPAASPATSPARDADKPMRDADKDGKRDSADKAPSDPTKK